MWMTCPRPHSWLRFPSWGCWSCSSQHANSHKLYYKTTKKLNTRMVRMLGWTKRGLSHRLTLIHHSSEWLGQLFGDLENSMIRIFITRRSGEWMCGQTQKGHEAWTHPYKGRHQVGWGTRWRMWCSLDRSAPFLSHSGACLLRPLVAGVEALHENMILPRLIQPPTTECLTANSRSPCWAPSWYWSLQTPAEQWGAGWLYGIPSIMEETAICFY